MADAGLFVGFGLPVRGREQQAVGVFNEAVQYYSTLQQQGEIEGSRRSCLSRTAASWVASSCGESWRSWRVCARATISSG